MVVSTSYDNLSEELQQQLAEYSQSLTNELNKAFKELAEAGVKDLQQTKPYHDRTGKYAKGFVVSQRKNQSAHGAQSFTIHNKKHYQITHLLEHGHLTRSGRRAREFKHWQTALDEINKSAGKAIEKAVKNTGK